MNTFIIIMAILFFLVNLMIGLMLFAIWRAVLGKSSVDFQLSTTMTMVGKKMETLSGSMDRHASGNADISKELREVGRNIQQLFDKDKK
jgi:hypothetical protein